jgi:cell division septation protein DedD
MIHGRGQGAIYHALHEWYHRKRMKKIINRAGLSCIWIKKLPTKTSINVIFLSLMIFIASAYAAEETWVYVSEREDDLWFVNTDTIMCRGDRCKASVKMQPLPERHKYSIELNEYACTEMKYKTLRITTYYSNRNTVKSIVPERQEWNYIVPRSVSKELYGFVCNKANHKKTRPNANEINEEQLTVEKPAREYEAEKQEDSTKKVPLQDAVSLEEVETQSVAEEDKKETPLQSQNPSDTIYTVQVGAFNNSSHAEALIARLKEEGYTAYIILSGSKKGGELYKVCIGKFVEREKAKTLSDKIKNSEGLQTLVTSFQP